MAGQRMPLTSTLMPSNSPWFAMAGSDPYQGEPLTDADIKGIMDEVAAKQTQRNMMGLPTVDPNPLPSSQIPYAPGYVPPLAPPASGSAYAPMPSRAPIGGSQGFQPPQSLPKGGELAKQDLLQELFNTQKNAANAMRGNMTPFLDQFQVLRNTDQEADLAPLAALVDQWSGSNFARTYKAPESLYDRAREVTGQADKFRQAADQQDLSALQNLVEGRRAEAKAESDASYKRQMLGLEREKLGVEKFKAFQKAGAGPEIKDSQWMAGLYGRRMDDANKIMEDIYSNPSALHFATSANGAFNRALPSGFQGENTKRIRQAEENFVNAVLRRESGSAIGPDEFKKAESQYFPRMGDPQSVIDQKNATRRRAIEGMKHSAGRAWDQFEENPYGGMPGLGQATEYSEEDRRAAAAEYMRRRGGK